MNKLVYNNKGFLISGSLLDDNMRPIVGANVTEIATGNQTQTDADGNFLLTVASMNNTIRFSHVSFDYDEIKASEFQSYYQLYPNSQVLDEIKIINNAKSSNLLGWILGIGIVGYIGYNVFKKKPKTVYI